MDASSTRASIVVAPGTAQASTKVKPDGAVPRTKRVGTKVEHTPRRQPCPVGHTRPQAPQLARSLCRLAHAVPQALSPVAQPQRPDAQICESVHTTPHAPQLSWLVTSIQRPPQAS